MCRRALKYATRLVEPSRRDSAKCQGGVRSDYTACDALLKFDVDVNAR